jgi:prepilin-type N-terminal cleavage/methylation domain-containing protein
MHCPTKQTDELALRRGAGFTLIELSIVLVIIGLIAGGVLVGQSLIKGSAIRATLSQKESVDTAVYTFRNKFGALPGDMGSRKATTFGFATRPTSHATNCGYGDENGLLQSWSLSWVTSCDNSTGMAPYGEPLMFWRDLSDAGLIADQLDTATMVPACCAVITYTTSPGFKDYLPPAKIGGGNYLFAFSRNSQNYLGLAKPTQFDVWMNTTQNSIAIVDAQTIDQKIDNGLADTGKVLARRMSPNSLNQTDAACANYGNTYQISVNGPNSVTCSLVFQAPW